jgi:hypothetical protein
MLQTANPHRWPISEALTPKRGVRAAGRHRSEYKNRRLCFHGLGKRPSTIELPEQFDLTGTFRKSREVQLLREQ